MKARLATVIVIVLLVSTLVASCATPTPEPTQAPPEAAPTEAPAEPTEAPAEPTEVPPPPAPEFIEFGCSMPVTGKFASLGSMVLPGYEVAVKHINADGGIYVAEYDAKIPIRLTVYDDESDPTKVVSKMEALNSELDLTIYLGGAGSDLHAAAAPIAEKNKIPYFGVAFALYSIHQQGFRYLFSPFPKTPQQGEDIFAVLDSIPEDIRPNKVAIFQETTDWGIESAESWQAAAEAGGYEVVFFETYAPGAGEFSSMISGAKAAGAEVLLSLPVPPDGVALARQLEELGWAPEFTLMIRAPEAPTWVDQGARGQYLTIQPGWHNSEDFPGVDELNATFQEDYGRKADLLSGPAYACVQIAAQAIENAGTLDTEAVRDAIAAIDMMTVVGPVTFNEDGTGNVYDPLIQWQDYEQVVVWPPELATHDLAFPAPPFDER
jgi:branched-chain amino acid transport system substrate-binding protein